MTTDCDCGTERVETTTKCGECKTEIKIYKCNDCGLKVRRSFPSECDCWMNY